MSDIVDYSDPPMCSDEGVWTGVHSVEDIERELLRHGGPLCGCVRCGKLRTELYQRKTSPCSA
jgi:hypothetical protein